MAKAKVLKSLAEIPPVAKKQELPGMTGKGVEPMKIPVLDKFISKYESHKEKRCAESPGELAAKKELKFALQQQKASLPLNSEGKPFYRSAEFERDYILDETMKIKKVGVDEDEND